MSAIRPALDLAGTTLVVGLGKSGLSMVRALHRLGAERVIVTDSRAEPPGLAEVRAEFPGLECHLGGFAAAPFAKASRILLSPGVAAATPVIRDAAARGVPVWGDIELFARLTTAPVVAITGANGKSTVTTLVGEMARCAGVRVAVGGNLGTPALELGCARPDAELYVLELSSFQLETTHSLAARAATVLNISPDHMDRYPSVWAYAEAKRRIFHGGGVMVLNRDDALVVAMAEHGREQRWFGLQAPRDERDYGLLRDAGRIWLARGGERLLAADELRIGGEHNLANALAALALGEAAGLPRAAMTEALRGFPGLPHRCQLVGEGSGVRWYDDSKGTNVGATVAAVRGLPGPLLLIAGGDGKGQDFAPLAEALGDKVKAVILIGRDAPLIERAVAGRVASHRAADLDAAVELAARLAVAGDSVLLSPACASFDMFRNYEERGRVFAAAVARVMAC
ncbi:MAG TPA: UDP-N-acetylmuramoyl-L-alanine--D-glutamate ligase [Candidatus Competibacteraceae bacterium]|nr:UDP-N-acetylmuramoyl-L-alanine--D-glutamate ligase [Candidatus Competibacteraceae bacterium]